MANRDFPNMSYAMFRNTALAINQIIEALDEAANKGEPLELLPEEFRCFSNLEGEAERLLCAINEYRSSISSAARRNSGEND